MIKDKYGNPRDEKEILEDVVSVWTSIPDSKKGVRDKAFLAEMLAGVKDRVKFIIHMDELCKEREEEEKIMCKEHEVKEITKKLKELEKLLESLKKESSPYDKVGCDEKYYYINSYLQVVEDRDTRCDIDDIRHSYANYMDKKNAIRRSKEM